MNYEAKILLVFAEHGQIQLLILEVAFISRTTSLDRNENIALTLNQYFKSFSEDLKNVT